MKFKKKQKYIDKYIDKLNSRKDIIYIQPCVIQRLNGAILARLYLGKGPVVYIQTSLANTLYQGDCLIPQIPVRMLNKNYVYKTKYGETICAPMLKEVLPQEYSKLRTIPPIKDKFYFIDSQIKQNEPIWVYVQNNYTHKCRLFRKETY